jgi:large subunit ribosomal protein L35
MCIFLEVAVVPQAWFVARRGFFFKEGIVKKNKKMKLKTHRGAAKRFKITSTGKVMRWHSGKRHLLGTKSPRRQRKLANKVEVNPADVRNVRLALPYGR